MSVEEIYSTFEDYSWQLLDMLHLSGVFEKYNLPSIIFPIGVLALILCIFLLTAQPGVPQTTNGSCGDGFCDSVLGETKTTCPMDCGKSVESTKKTKKVRVLFDQKPECGLYVSLYVADDAAPFRKYALEKETIFSNIDASSAYALIEGPLGETYETDLQDLDSEDNTINVLLPENICGTTNSQKGVLTVIVKDQKTKSVLNGVRVSISESANGRATNYQYTKSLVNGQKDFSLPTNRNYVVFAEKEGYVDYNGLSTPIKVPAGRPVTKSISMSLLSDETEQAGGRLTVCLKNGTQPLLSGIIKLKSLSGQVLSSGDVSESGNGCFSFEDIDVGKTVIAALPDPPTGCLSAVSPQLTISSTGTDSIVLPVTCSSEEAYLKVRVLDEPGSVITQNASITVWNKNNLPITGHAFDGSLSIGDFGYTEELSVPANELIHVLAQPTTSNYLENQSDSFSLSSREHKILDMVLMNSPDAELTTSTEVPIDENLVDPETGEIGTGGGFGTGIYAPSGELIEPELAISGVTVPLEVTANNEFTASIGEVTYGESLLDSDSANVTITIDGEECAVEYNNVWIATCQAPGNLGLHTLVFKAEKNSKIVSEQKIVDVVEYNTEDKVSIIPVPPTRGNSPLDLTYQITLNGIPVENITNQSISITYKDVRGAYAGHAGTLQNLGGGYWSLPVDALFKGDYEITLTIDVFRNNIHYTTTQSSTFTSYSMSKNLDVKAEITTKVLDTGEEFDITLYPSYKIPGHYPIFPEGLDFWVYLDGTYTQLSENEGSYSTTLTAPSMKSCSLPLRLALHNSLIEISDTSDTSGAKSKDIKLNVIDVSGSKAYSCPLDNPGGAGSCDTIEEMRKCVYNYKADMGVAYTEQQIISCISGACYGDIPLQCPDQNLGDLDGDCRMTEDDSNLAKRILEDTPSLADSFKPCADINQDGKFDEKDTECIKKVAGGRWYGDLGTGIFEGDGECKDDMYGAFCFNIDTASILPGDLNGNDNLDTEDSEILDKIIDVVNNRGLQPSQPIIDKADFDRNGILNRHDLTCLNDLSLAIDFESGQVRGTAESGISPIEPDCLNIFDMDCLGVKADLNADGKVTNDDYLLLSLITKGILQVNNLPPGMNKCADVNGDGSITKGDILCMQNLLDDDRDAWLQCLDCEDSLPRLAYGIEICGDGYDNDCNGKKDLVPGIEDEVCMCEEGKTPCYTKKDLDGGVKPGIKDGNFAYCREVSWEIPDPTTGDVAIGFQWYDQAKLNCTKDLNCASMKCNESSDTYLCSLALSNIDVQCEKLNQTWKDKQIFSTYYCYHGGIPGHKTPFALGWFPQEQSATGVTKLPSIDDICEDGWDNDCNGGDKHCPSYWHNLVRNPVNLGISFVAMYVTQGWAILYYWERANSYNPTATFSTPEGLYGNAVLY